jgi:DnaJ-class molecular chaperone
MNKLLVFIKVFFKMKDYSVPNAKAATHKYCTVCDGSGREDLFYDCDACEGIGIIRKTYQEYVDSLPLDNNIRETNNEEGRK